MSVPSYHKEALCSGQPNPDLWSYETSVWKDIQMLNVYKIIAAKSVCNECPVKDSCLKEGLQKENMELNDGQGQGIIWGGLMVSERAELLGYGENSRLVINEKHIRKEVTRITIKVGR